MYERDFPKISVFPFVYLCAWMHVDTEIFSSAHHLIFWNGISLNLEFIKLLNGTVRAHSLLAYISSSSEVKVWAMTLSFYVNAANTGINSYPYEGSHLLGPKIHLSLTYRRIFKSQKLHNYIEILSNLQWHRHRRESFGRMIFCYEIWIQNLYRGWENVQSVKSCF